MDNEPTPIAPQPSTPIPLPDSALAPQVNAAPPAPAKKTFGISPSIIFVVIAAAALIIGGILGLSAVKSQQQAIAPPPTLELVTPTPTPVRTLSSLATQQTFMQFEAANATLSAAIASYSVQDETLTPPTLVLPLGFQQ